MSETFTPSNARALALAALLAVPGLATAQSRPSTQVQTQALSQLGTQRAKLGLSEADLANAAVTSASTDAAGITHLYLRQRYQGLEIYGTESDVHLDRNQKITSLHSTFVPNVAVAARGAATTPTLTPVQAIAAAARALGIAAPGNLTLEKAGEPAQGLVYSNGGISWQNIPVKLMYQRTDAGLVLVWDVDIDDKRSEHFWSARVNASTGQLVDKLDHTISEPISFGELTAKALGATNWQQTAATPAPEGRPNAINSYRVWPLTIESPNHGTQQLVTNPASTVYSPFGWHDTNGVAGAEYTITRGNNVAAYEDRANAGSSSGTPATNGLPGGYSPDGGADLVFDFPFNAAAAPVLSQDAAITNLFYWNNLIHDIMAYKGFDEVSGNFQEKNYTGLGAGDDFVRAEAQDGGGVNNANFSTPRDGLRPRMQMYLWPGTAPTAVNVTSPTTASASYNAIPAVFGKKLMPGTPLTGRYVLVNDAGSTTLGCTVPFINAATISGNIAVLERGTCDFAAKVRNAKVAGARAVVVINNAPGDPIAMGGTDTVNTGIPSFMISQADGTALKTALAANATVTGSILGQIPPPDRDGDYDNGIIAHEYGHGISNRLTGGPSVSGCLSNAEQMGEGWSDFFGLWMTTKPGDVGTTPRGIGTYVSYQPTTGSGIRPQRYSTDWAVNNQTYAMVGVAPYTAVHAVGSIWCATLWDLNWALIRKYGYNQNLTAATGGNNVALKLVLDGCKLQRCSPGFVDGRDGILKADSLYNNAANASLIWQVFARRGVGYSASQGSSNSLTDQVAAYDLPPGVLATQQQLSEASLDVYPNPANNQLTVRTQLNSSTPVQVSLVTVLGATVHTYQVAATELQQQGVQINTSGLKSGLYLVKVSSEAGVVTKKVLVQH